MFRWTNSVLAGRCLGFSPASATLAEIDVGLSYITNLVGQPDQPERSSKAWRLSTEVPLTQPLGAAELT